MVLCLDPYSAAGFPSIEELYGFRLGGGIVIDTHHFENDPLMPVLKHFAMHPVTENLSLVVFDRAGSLEFPDNIVRTSSYSELVSTSRYSWVRKGLSGPEQVADPSFKSRTDVRGPVTVAAGFERPAGDGVSRCVVIRDSDFITDSLINLGGNSDLFLNSINWVTDRQVFLGKRTYRTLFSGLDPGPLAKRVLFILILVMIPGVFIVAGILTWLRRS